jgi:general secretion pathway protein H
MRARRPDSGLTLVEIMVVLAIIGLVGAAMTVGVSRLTKADLKGDARRLAGALRSAFDRATARGTHHRVNLDLVDQTFFVESCTGKARVTKAESLIEDEEQEQERLEKLRKQAETPIDETMKQLMANVGQTVGDTGGGGGAACTPVKGELGKPYKLKASRGVRMTKVHVARFEEPVTDGKLAVNFFPLGYGERTAIEISDGDDTLTVFVHPISGQVQIKNGTNDADRLVRRDAEGEEVKP